MYKPNNSEDVFRTYDEVCCIQFHTSSMFYSVDETKITINMIRTVLNYCILNFLNKQHFIERKSMSFNDFNKREDHH